MYAKISDNSALSFSELRAAFPNTAFPESGPDADWLDENGYAVLNASTAPVTPVRCLAAWR